MFKPERVWKEHGEEFDDRGRLRCSHSKGYCTLTSFSSEVLLKGVLTNVRCFGDLNSGCMSPTDSLVVSSFFSSHKSFLHSKRSFLMRIRTYEYDLFREDSELKGSFYVRSLHKAL